ncbi:MAG: hypothetical protein LBR29_02000 [Methylobacteriaceae bacterium]|jgi:hypothetical protein|nr:hypothetical protein [Methylobacteriaceae bacterium]
MFQALSRILLFASVMALPLAGCTTTGADSAPPGYSSVKVDASSYRNQGYKHWADLVEQAGNAEAKRLFPLRKGGPRLVIRVDSVFLTAFAGRGEYDEFSSGGSDNDSIEATAVVVDGNGRTICNARQLSSLDAGSGGAWYLPDNEPRRVQALARNSVQWFSRRIRGLCG